MQETSIIQVQFATDEFRAMVDEVVRKAIRAEVSRILAIELNRILATPEENRRVPRSEAMELIGIKSRTTILGMEKAGDLVPIRLGGNRVGYSLQNIQDLLSKRKKA